MEIEIDTHKTLYIRIVTHGVTHGMIQMRVSYVCTINFTCEKITSYIKEDTSLDFYPFKPLQSGTLWLTYMNKKLLSLSHIFKEKYRSEYLTNELRYDEPGDFRLYWFESQLDMSMDNSLLIYEVDSKHSRGLFNTSDTSLDTLTIEGNILKGIDWKFTKYDYNRETEKEKGDRLNRFDFVQHNCDYCVFSFLSMEKMIVPFMLMIGRYKSI